jgi:hypothetical protein
MVRPFAWIHRKMRRHKEPGGLSDQVGRELTQNSQTSSHTAAVYKVKNDGEWPLKNFANSGNLLSDAPYPPALGRGDTPALACGASVRRGFDFDFVFFGMIQFL